MRRGSAALAFALLGAGGLSCELLLGLEYPVPDSVVPAPAVDASDPCAHAAPPPKADRDDDPTTERDYWFAIDRVALPLPQDGGVKPGFDLDLSCTCQRDLHDGAPSCDPPRGAPVSCDFDGGVDDSLAIVAAGVTVVGVDPAEHVNRQIAQGLVTSLLFLGRYNGKANDNDVSVMIVPSNGLFSNLGCGGVPRPGTTPSDGGTTQVPQWDGCDQWSPSRGLVQGNSPARVPILVSPAYVTDHVVVVHLDEFRLGILGTNGSIQGGIAVARLVPDGASFRLEGTIAGRLPFTQFVDAIGRIAIALPSDAGFVGLCKTQFWPTITPILCPARDVMEHPSQDGLGLTCNAGSVTIGFTARQAFASDDEFDIVDPGIDCDASAVCP